MFAGARAFNQPLNHWNLPSLQSATGMFYDSAMNQDLSCWNLIDTVYLRDFYRPADTNDDFGYNYGDDMTDTAVKNNLEATCWYNATSEKVDNSLCSVADRTVCSTPPPAAAADRWGFIFWLGRGLSRCYRWWHTWWRTYWRHCVCRQEETKYVHTSTTRKSCT